jgi:hypothetical protein
MNTNYFSTRKLILSLAASLALAASPALAHPWHGAYNGWHGHHGGGYGWGPAVGLGIAGALIGGALAYPYYAQPECWVQYDQWGQAYRACR